jgi:DNA-binding CsgD family transcriptional regulator
MTNTFILIYFFSICIAISAIFYSVKLAIALKLKALFYLLYFQIASFLLMILFLINPNNSSIKDISCAIFQRSLLLGIVFLLLKMMTLYFFNGFCWGIGGKVIPIIYKYVFISTMILSCACFVLYWSSPQNSQNTNGNIIALSKVLDIYALYFLIVPILYLLGITGRQLDYGIKKMVKYIALYYISFILFYAAILFRLAEPYYLCSYLIIMNSLPVAGMYYHFKNDLDHDNKKDNLASLKVSHTMDISRREYEIVGKMLQGKSNNQIAAELFLSRRTVDTHIYNIYKKLSIKNRFQLFNLFQNELYGYGLKHVSVEKS